MKLKSDLDFHLKELKEPNNVLSQVRSPRQAQRHRQLHGYFSSFSGSTGMIRPCAALFNLDVNVHLRESRLRIVLGAKDE